MVGITPADCLEVGEIPILAREIGFADFFAEIRGFNFYGAAHFVKAAADSGADAFGERVFAIGGDGFTAWEAEGGASVAGRASFAARGEGVIRIGWLIDGCERAEIVLI